MVNDLPRIKIIVHLSSTPKDCISDQTCSKKYETIGKSISPYKKSPTPEDNIGTSLKQPRPPNPTASTSNRNKRKGLMSVILKSSSSTNKVTESSAALSLVGGSRSSAGSDDSAYGFSTSTASPMTQSLHSSRY